MEMAENNSESLSVFIWSDDGATGGLRHRSAPNRWRPLRHGNWTEEKSLWFLPKKKEHPNQTAAAEVVNVIWLKFYWIVISVS